MNARRHLAVFVFTCLALACAPEEPSNLFDENGVWALTEYSLVTGDPSVPIDDDVRGNAFLLRFSSEHNIVAAASCASEGGTNEGVGSSTCKINPSDAEWVCRCYAYSFEGSLMSMQYFAPGEMPPVLSDTDGDEGENDPSDAVEVAEVEGAPNSFTYFGLPAGLFDSDGDTSRHILTRKAETVWTGSNVPADLDGDGMNDLEACTEGCFGGPL
jgi:hypothetical protein